MGSGGAAPGKTRRRWVWSYEGGLPAQGRAEGVAVGGDDLDRPRQVGGGGAVEEGAVREADVGQQVAVSFGLGRQHPLEVGPDEQPGDADVAAEELVLHR